MQNDNSAFNGSFGSLGFYTLRAEHTELSNQIEIKSALICVAPYHIVTRSSQAAHSQPLVPTESKNWGDSGEENLPYDKAKTSREVFAFFLPHLHTLEMGMSKNRRAEKTEKYSTIVSRTTNNSNVLHNNSK